MKPNNSLKRFEFLLGLWEAEISNASFLPDRSAKMKGRTTFTWVEDGAFLVERQADERGQVQAVWLIGHDEATGKYEVLYYDTNFRRQASRIYETDVKNNIWRKWRNANGFSQRFEGTPNRDKNQIKGQWESSEDGIHWKHDFDLVYSKIEGVERSSVNSGRSGT
jgi:hypothetical protein